MIKQLSLFDNDTEFKIGNKEVRLVEAFAGYGSQKFALEYLGVKHTSWKIIEWNYKSFHAYRKFHHYDDNTDYSQGKSDEEISDFILNKGVSADWNSPMTKTQLMHMSESDRRKIYSDIIATKNLVDISKTHCDDLDMSKDRDDVVYMFTYSFPCQDLSLAGKRMLMSKEEHDSGKSTRSGLLWEVDRILKECHEHNCLPNVLLMENVPQVHGKGAIDDFNIWQQHLENYGYSNFWQDLKATDYEIPQTRNRCFMVSLLGKYNYEFPEKKPLKLKLKDMLENDVPEKYFLSEKMMQYITSSPTLSNSANDDSIEEENTPICTKKNNQST